MTLRTGLRRRKLVRAIMGSEKWSVVMVCAGLWCLPTARLFAWKLAESNLFLLERSYFEETFFQVGGPLDYAAHGLATFLGSPWTGLPSIAGVWLLLTGVTAWVSGIQQGPWRWLNALPGGMALGLTAYMGFGIWTTRVPEVFFQIALGLMVTLSCYGIAARRGAVSASVLAALLYVSCGAWGFFFALGIGIRWMLFAEKGSALRRGGGMVPALVVSAVPYLLIRCNLLALSPWEAYSRHLLVFRGDNLVWDVGYVCTVLIALSLPLVNRVIRLPGKAWASGLAALPFATAMIMLGGGNAQLGTVLAIEKAAKEGRWTELLGMGRGEGQPHRLVSAYRILALYKTERLGQELFEYPVARSHLSTPVETLRLNGELIYYEYGLVLNARKELMEKVVLCGLSAERLRLLGLIAYVTSERAAAGVYFEKLGHLPFYREEAEHWLRVVQGEEAPPPDVESVAASYDTFRKAGPLLFMGGNTRLEEDIYSSYKLLRDCPRNMGVLCLCVYLLEKTPERLAQNADALEQIQSNHELPVALQEGLLLHLASVTSPAERERLDYAGMGISRQTVGRWNEFLALRSQWAGSPGQLREAMQASFGKTYWYYHVFTP